MIGAVEGGMSGGQKTQHYVASSLRYGKTAICKALEHWIQLMTDTVLDRFLRYVVVDTQSDPASSTQPSTEKQKTLGRMLVEELLAIGLFDAHLDEHGYVYATIPSNIEKPAPVICFCSHMDTAPDFTGNGRQAADRSKTTAAATSSFRATRGRSSGSPTTLRCSTRLATTSSRPTARLCSAPTTRPGSPRS